MSDDAHAKMPMAPTPRPHAGRWPMYQTGRTQYPLASAPMQTAMSREVWAGAQLGQWEPLAGYGAGYPAAPRLAPMQEAMYLVTQPMHNEVGYQMVAVRDNGVPIGGTPATTPQYVTAGPIQSGYSSFVQPIMRIEQTPLAGAGRLPQDNPAFPTRRRIARSARRNPMPSDPSGPMELPIDPRSGPWRWNNMQGPTVGPMGGGPGAWPFVTPPPGYMMAGTNEGGWPVFALDPVAPPDLPEEVPHLMERAATNPAFPAALSGIPLLATGVAAGALTGGATAWRASRSSPREEAKTARRAQVRQGKVLRVEKPVAVKRVTVVPQGGQAEVKMMQATPVQNPVVWPWVLGGFAAIGAGAYGAWRCSPGQRLFSTDSLPGSSVTRTLDFEGCFQEHPWRAHKITQVSVPGVEPIEEARAFKEKRDALAWLYTGEEPPAGGEELVPEDNPRGHGMAGRFARRARQAAGGVQPAPGTHDCRPVKEGAEKSQSAAKADQFFNAYHRAPNSGELNELVNEVYKSVYPYGPYPIPSPTHPCAKNWLVIRGRITARIKARLQLGKLQGAPRWWMRGDPAQQMSNPIPGSVGYNGYFHGEDRIPGSSGYNGYTHGEQGIPGSSGYNGYTHNPVDTVKRTARAVRMSPQNAMAIQLGAASVANQAAQQHKLNAARGAVQALRANPGVSVADAMGMMMARDSRQNQAAQQHQLNAARGTVQSLRANPGVSVADAMGMMLARDNRQNLVAEREMMRAAAGTVAAAAPIGARAEWSGFRSTRRLDTKRLLNPHGEACCGSCAIGKPCEGGCDSHDHGHGKPHGACCDSCAVGGPCEGCGVAGGCNCK